MSKLIIPVKEKKEYKPNRKSVFIATDTYDELMKLKVTTGRTVVELITILVNYGLENIEVDKKES